MIAGILITFLILLFVCHFYGIILCFRRKWYIGLASIVVPLFATIIGGARLFFKRDLLG